MQTFALYNVNMIYCQMQKACCFTGHRPKSLPWGYNEEGISCSIFKRKLKKTIEKLMDEGVTHFISGMAMGVDLIAAEIIIEFKKQYDNVSLEAAIPCKNQTKGWSFEYIERYNNILEYCDKVTYVSDIYTYDCMLKRNRYMVDNCDVVIAVWNGVNRSGTGSTINYAQKQDKRVIIFDI